MIYLVTKQDISLPDVTLCSIQDSLDYLNKFDSIGVDTETGGFDPYTCKFYTLQLGDQEVQYVIDLSTIDIQEYKKLLETKELIGHNFKFDLRFLYHQRIVPTRVYDTFLGEKTARLGIESHRCSLAACVQRHCGVTLSKEERANITGRLTEGFVKYSAYDVKYLHEIKSKQNFGQLTEGTDVSMELDNRFVLVLAYIEYCGMKLDVEQWTKKIEKVQIQADEAVESLNKFILENKMTKFIDYQLDMFSSGNKINVNWNSPSQVVEFFESIGVDTTVVEKGVKKQTIEANHLGKFASKYPIIKTYLSFKEAQKDIGTYGYNWIEQINPVSGRIHTQFKQLMNTGRLSSGGKSGTVKNFNFQNIPSDQETRSCFVAAENNLLISCDYTAQESVVLANQCLDPSLLEFYDKGLSDMHSFIASKMFKELNGLSLDDIKSKHKDKRQQSKVIGFALAYGGSAKAISDQLNLSPEEGEDIYKKYFLAFPDLDRYYTEAKKFGVEKGYVLLSPVTGKKCYVDYFEEFKEIEQELKDKEFWERYKRVKNSGTPTAQSMKDKVSRYFRKKGDIERMSLNYRVQGESAEISKLAGIYFWRDYLIPKKLFNVVKIVNIIHDEYLIECPESIIEECSSAIQHAMEKSAAKFCKRVRLGAEPAHAKYWKK
jgi:DNA polymerase I-like protein with 3'-5' exonuclease and polymerase domains